MLILSAELRRRIAEWASRGYPRECCGLLVGRVVERADRELAEVARVAKVARVVEVVEVTESTNCERERPRERFELDPADLLAAENRARARGLELVGVWHSHPDRPAEPSALDRAAAWPGWSYVIQSVGSGVALELASWRTHEQRFESEELLTA